MRNVIASIALAGSLFGFAGMADARGFEGPAPRAAVVVRGGREVGHGPIVGRGPVFGRGEVGYGYRDFGHRPDRYAEHFAYRAGYNWHAGDWSWNGYEWIWVPGYYVRIVL